MSTKLAGFPPAMVVGEAPDASAPAANTAAVLPFAADPGNRHVIDGLAFSYDAAPTDGSLQIEDGTGNIIFGPHYITAAGMGLIQFGGKGKAGSVGVAMIVTLAAGGAGIKGSVSALNHWVE